MANQARVSLSPVLQASRASVALCRTLELFESQNLGVARAVSKLKVLTHHLHSLSKTIQGTPDVDLSALNLPLKYWADICEELRQEFQKYLPVSREEDSTFHVWNRLGYAGGDIYDFGSFLNDYDSVIVVALIYAHLDEDFQSVEEMRAHDALVKTTIDELATWLARTEDKFNALRTEGAEELQPKPSKLRQIEIKKSITLACVQACQRFSERIKQTLSALEEETGSLKPASKEIHTSSEYQVSKIENTGSGDVFQVMFTTGKVLHAANRGNGWFVRQGGGIMKDETATHVTNVLATTIPQYQGQDLRGQGRDNPAPRSAIHIDQALRFEERYGAGKATGTDHAQ